MILHSNKFKLGFGALALVVMAGCGSEAGSSTPTEPTARDAASVSALPQSIGTLTGHYRNGHASFDESKSTLTGRPGLTTQGFGTFTLNKIAFDTAAGDGVGVAIAGCSPTRYCALVSVTNNTGVALQSLFVEITDYFAIAPAGSAPSWAGTPFTRSAAYKSVFVNGAGTVEAADFGDFAAGETKVVPFIFEIDGATTFDFHVTEYATFPRNTISGSGISNDTSFNACATPGNTLVTDVDDQEVPVALPFPHTFVDRTYDRAVISSNGYMLFYATGDAQPTISAGNNNTDILPGWLTPGIYPFWDDLAYDTGVGAVCTQTIGATPNRRYIISWSSAKIANNQPTIPKTFAAETVTYSVVLDENTDEFRMLYTLPSGGVTSLTRGGSATIQFTYYRGGGLEHQVYGYNGPSLPPADPNSYPYSFQGTQFDHNP